MINETYFQSVDEVSVKISASAVESLRTKKITRTGLRVYRDGYIGVAGFMGAEGESRARGRALAALENKISYPCEPAANMARAENVVVKRLSAEDLLAEAEAMLAALRRDFPQFIFSGELKTGTEGRKLSSDAGLDLSSSFTGHAFNIMYKLAASPSIIDGYLAFAGPDYGREAFLAHAAEVLAAYLREVPLPKEGKMPVIFNENEQAVKGIFQGELSGRAFASGGSLFSGKTGQKLFADGFTLYNSRNTREDGVDFFDAEGVCGDGFKYVENGVLRAPYADKKTAAQCGLAPSGSAAAEYDAVPSSGAGLMKIAPQKKTLKEMPGGRKAVFVAVALGGNFTSEGVFGTPVQTAFLLEDGKLTGRLPELQLSSSVYEMYGKDFLGVSSDRIMPLSSARWLGFEMTVRRT